MKSKTPPIFAKINSTLRIIINSFHSKGSALSPINANIAQTRGFIRSIVSRLCPSLSIFRVEKLRSSRSRSRSYKLTGRSSRFDDFSRGLEKRSVLETISKYGARKKEGEAMISRRFSRCETCRRPLKPIDLRASYGFQYKSVI